MTNIKSLINDLGSKNISLSLENDNIKIHAPKGILNKIIIKQISENKKLIIDFLKYQQHSQSNTKWVAEKKEFYEASVSQKRMYLLQQINKEFTVYNIPFVLEINGELEINKIKNAFNVLIENHEILRTYFKQIEGKIYQFIDKNLEIEIEVLKAENKDIKEVIKSIIKPIELTELPLFNVGIIEVSDSKQILVVNLHHILIDAISIKKIINKFHHVFSGKTLSKDLLQYKDFSTWTQSKDYQKILEKSKKYWLKQFDNEIPNLELPYDYNRPEIQSFKGDRLTFEIDFYTKKRVDKFINDASVTSFTFYISVFYLLFSKLSNQEDIILGAPINGRIKKEYEDLIGLFINTIALRNYPDGEKSFLQFLNEVKISVLEAIENESYPFEDLLDSLKLNRDLGKNPLFNIMFSYVVNENSRKNNIVSNDDKGIQINSFDINQVKFDIDIQGFEKENNVMFVVDYSTDLFKKSTVLRFLKYYQNIIHEILDNKSVKLKDIEFIEHDEKLKLLFNLNNTNTSFPKDKTIAEIFESEANNNFDRTALVFNDEQISYGELNKRANQLAFLLRSKGVEQNSVVGLFLDRSIEMIIGIIATLKSGGTYLPIDSGFPSSRIKYMINDSGTKFLVSKSSIIKDFSYSNILNYDSISQNGCKTNSRESIKVLDSMPFADRSLIDCEKYNKFIGMAMMKNAVSIQATRGCPYKCLYCHKIWPKSHYVRSAENIFEEVKMYYDMGVKRFAFIDDIFNLRKKNSERFFKLIIENNLNIQISFPNGIRGDILTPDYIDLMVEAGTINMAIALETASPRIQKLIKKNINLTRLKENMEYIASKHPHVLMDIFTMHGFPTETEDEALKTIEFIKSIKWLHFPYFHILKIYPNTDMANLAMENGISHDLIAESVSMAYHELPNTLPFEHSFTKKIQAELLEKYILNKERLLHVLPHQMRVLTKNELVQKYDSYLPIDIKNYDELLKYLNVSEQELSGIEPAEESCYEIENYNLKLANTFGKHKSNPDALKVLLLDLSQNFSNSDNMLYDVVEPPLGLIYLLTNLNKEFGGEISGKIAKSRIDFDSYDDLKKLIEEFNPDVIGIRTLSFYKDFFHLAAQKIRDWGFNIPIIAGGPYASSDYNIILKDPNIDLVVFGEGEITFTEVIKVIIENNKKLPGVDVLKGINGIILPEIKNNNTQLVLLDSDNKNITRQPTSDLKSVNNLNDICYIIYTSGTTGKPKGSMIEHGNLVRLFFNDDPCFNFTSKNIWTMFHSYCFDFSVWEMYGALLFGGKLILVPKMIAKDTDQFRTLIKKQSVDILNQTPSAFYNLLSFENNDIKSDLNLEYVIFGGEALNPKKLEKWNNKYPNTRLINMYGITETTVHVTYKEISSEEIQEGKSYIGKPIPTLATYVLDANSNLSPTGVVGELCVSGEGVSRGYLNQPELSDDKFVFNPFVPNEKLYKSGDLAKFLDNGELEYLGRKDLQVKIRGFRIELGDIESHLIKHSKVKDVVVVFREIKKGEKNLCAYYISDIKVDSTELRTFLLESVPDYMVPVFFIQIQKIPLTSTGKVDIKQLENPHDLTTNIILKPINIYEQHILEIWSEVFGIKQENISTDMNFFEIGGNSLNATTILSKVHEKCDIKLSYMEIFKNQTIRELASVLSELANTLSESANDIQNKIPFVEKKEYYKISSSQKRLFFLYELDEKSTAYNVPICFKLDGVLNTQNIQNAFSNLVKRHDALRTSFKLINNEPKQIIHTDIDFKIDYYQLNDNTINSVFKSFTKNYDLSVAPLFRVAIYSKDKNSHFLLIDMHHIITDGVSMNILVEEFKSFYYKKEIKKLNIQYKDYAEWIQSTQEKDRIKTQEKYWVDTFNDEIPILDLPYDYQRKAIKDFAGATEIFSISPSNTERLREIADSNGVTMYILLLSIYNILLSKLSAQEDISVGSPIANRQHQDLAGVIGDFVNTLVVRSFPVSNLAFSEYLNELKNKVISCFDNQDYPYEDIVEKVVKKRDLSRNPLFDVMFSYQNQLDGDQGIPNTDDDNRIENVSVAKFDLELVGFESKDHLFFSLVYDVGLFKTSTIKKIIRNFKNLVEDIIRDINKPISELNILEDEERLSLLHEFNNTKCTFPKDKTIVDLFEDQVLKTPDKISMFFGENKITYTELNKLSNKLAHHLISEGIVGSVVGILMPRSIEMIVSILAILKSGNFYLPIDPDYPEDRIDYMVKDSEIKMVLTKSESSSKYSFQGVTNYSFNLNMLELLNISIDKPKLNFTSKSTAYLIYTSGSTGHPKGIMISHRNVVNFYTGVTQRINFDSQEKILCLTTISFDIFVLELFVPLFSGMEIIMAGELEQTDPLALANLIHSKNINILQFTPSRLQMLLETQEGVETIKNVKVLMVGGEEFPGSLLESLKTFYTGKLYNMFGPTETTVWSTIKELTGSEKITIGTPIANTNIRILDKNDNIQPIGVPGELCISGEGLAIGYWKNIDLTNQKFITWKINGERLYKTGDLARWNTEGEIEFLGRIDNQVKIRGYRIELGEIESQLMTIGNISAVVVAKSIGNDKVLCAYYTDEKNISEDKIKSNLNKKLPSYMMPSFFIKLNEFPTTANGKIDRKSLPDPEINSAEEFIKPKNDIEIKLRKIWSEVLKLSEEEISVNANFFELGGHSLRASLVKARISKVFNVDIALTKIFEEPRICSLAEVIRSSVKTVDDKTIPLSEKKEYYNLSSAQKRMLTLYNMNPKGTSYNLPNVLKIKGKLDYKQFENSIKKIIQKHEILRSTFISVKDEYVQRIHDSVRFKIDVVTLENEDQEKEFITSFIRPFRLEEAPLIRVCLIKIKEGSHILLSDLHHIVTDGVSNIIINKEFIDQYQGNSSSQLYLQYKDFAEWQNKFIKSKKYEEQKEYWLSIFKEDIPEINLPFSFSRPAVRDISKANSLNVKIEGDLYLRAKELIKNENVTVYSFLLSCYYILISKYSRQNDIVVGTLVTGRSRVELNNTIGMFVNVLPIRNKPINEKPFIEFLNEVKTSALEAIDNQDYQYDDLVAELSLDRSRNRNPLFDTLFALNNIDSVKKQNSNKVEEEYDNSVEFAKFDMQWMLNEGGGQVSILLRYSTELFLESAVQKYIEHYLEIIDQVTKKPDMYLKHINLSHNLIETKSNTLSESSEFTF